MSNEVFVSAAPRPRQVIIATALTAFPAFVAVLILIRQLPQTAGGGGGNLLLLVLALPALAAGILTVGFSPGRDGIRRAAVVLCYVSTVLTGGVGVVSTVLAVMSAGKDRGPWDGVLTAILTVAAALGLFFAFLNAAAIRMLQSAPAQTWFAGHDHDGDIAPWRPTRALVITMVACGVAGVVHVLAAEGLATSSDGTGFLLRTENLGAYASIASAALAVPLSRGVARIRTIAIVTTSFGAFMWSLLLLLTLTSGVGLIGVAALLFTAAHLTMVVLLSRTDPLPAHDDTSV